MSRLASNSVPAYAGQPASATDPEAARTWLDVLAVVLVVGNLSLGRAFAHYGVSPVYIGELSLAIFLVVRWRALLATWVEALMRPEPLSGLTWLLLLSGVYGAAQCWRGIDAGYDRTIALQTFIFHLYPLFLFFGLWVGVRYRDFTPRLIRLLAWVHGIYGIAFMAFLHRTVPVDDLEPGEAGWFGDPGGSAIVLLGLLALERHWGRMWLPFLLNLGVLLALQVRAEMLGLAVGVFMWACLTGQFLRLCALILVAGAVLLAAAAVDVRIPSPATRGGEISAQGLLGKLIAPFDSKTAKTLKRDADIDADTVAWRTIWWQAIWRMVHKTTERTLLGPGYGYALWDLHPEAPPDFKVRTPHNVFMYALGYTGWVGVFLFAAMQLALAHLLWRAFRIDGQPFGLCLWVALLIKGSFENFFEAPFNAIPFYLLAGLALAPLYGAASSDGDLHDLGTENACERA